MSVCACVVEWMSDLTDGSLRGECKGVVEQLSQLYRAVPGPDCLRVRSGFQFTAAIPPDRLWAIVLPRIIIASVYNLLSIVSSVSGFCPLECVCWKSSPFEGCRVSQQVRRLADEWNVVVPCMNDTVTSAGKPDFTLIQASSVVIRENEFSGLGD